MSRPRFRLITDHRALVDVMERRGSQIDHSICHEHRQMNSLLLVEMLARYRVRQLWACPEGPSQLSCTPLPAAKALVNLLLLCYHFTAVYVANEGGN